MIALAKVDTWEQNEQYLADSLFDETSLNWWGYGYCSGHFGELLQGAFTSARGNLVRALVTLPCRSIGSLAWVRVNDGDGKSLTPSGKSKVRRVVEAFRRFYNISRNVDIEVRIESTIPSGIGMGSSTADIVATLRALDQAFGVTTTGNQIIKLTLSAEAACDSTMYCRNVKLFAQREGLLVEDFARPFMPLAILGFNLMPGDVFLTDESPPAEYDERNIAHFDILRNQLRTALRAGSAERVASVATASALINQQFYPKRNLEYLLDLRRKLGALGICISHSGTIAGLLFSMETVPTINEWRETVSDDLQTEIEPLGVFRV